jgi:hypothetical protein
MLALVTVIFLVTSLQYPPQARAMPLGVMLVLLVGLCAQVVACLRRGDAARGEEPRGEYLGEVRASLWLLLALASIYVFGLVATMGLYPLLYMRLEGRESWWLTLAVSAGLSLATYASFVVFLKIPMFPGVIVQALAKLFGL